MTKPGTIYKISIQNFVTYSDVVMYPGPNLNVVIGPNGTGKSTIVAAVILGLGGTPKTIGRGTKVSEYVKHDCSEARINIELHGNEEGMTVTVTRVFNLNNQNTWLLNNKQVNEQEIQKAVEKLNIQVDNLCQFLPQDRVQDFAKLDKKELLVNTQKAVGRQDLVDKHAKLIQIRKDQKEMMNDVEQLTTKLNQAKEDISRLEGKVQNVQEKKKIKVEIDHIKRKICWENYNKVLHTKQSVEEDKKQAEKILIRHQKKIQPIENKIKGLRHVVTVTQNQLQETRNNLNTLDIKVKKLLQRAEELDTSHSQIVSEMRVKLEKLAQFQNDIDSMRAKIDKLINDENSWIHEYGAENQIDIQAEKLRKGGTMYQSKCDDMNQQRFNAMNILKRTGEQVKHLQVKLEAIENIKDRRMEILERKDRDAHAVVLWLRENKHKFRGNVYEPVMIEINVLDPKNAKYLENIIPFRDRVAFTCEYREDMNLLLRSVRDGLGRRINVVHSGADHPPLTAYRPNIPIEQLKRYGFFAYMSSLISGPEPVVKYLCKMYQLHNIPIGDRSTNNKAAQVPDQVRLFFSDCHRYAVSLSRYTGQKSSKISNVQSDGTFSICVDMSSMNSIRRQLEEFHENQRNMEKKIKEFDTQKQLYENKWEQIRNERTILIQQKDQIKGLREKRIQAQRTLENNLKNHKTAEQIKNEGNQKIKDLIQNSAKIHKLVMTAISELDIELQHEMILNLELSVVNSQITQTENKIDDLRTEYQSVKATFDEINAIYITAVHDVQEAMKAAKKISDGFEPSERGFDKFRERYEQLSDDLDELNGMICELQTKMDCILTADDGELRQYEQGQRLLNLCQEELGTKDKKVTEFNKKIEKLYNEWIEPLQNVVNKINTNFGDYFESMQCSGEVSLSFDTAEDYISYGLSIRVTYRAAEPLQELNRYVQSGGERAVATAVYMLAMQDLTAAPFRCVDEINQGMDPQNERRIFEILVKVAGKRGTGQYFLITPKLIPALQFGEAMKVHIVHNGPFCEIDKNFRFRDLFRNDVN